MGQRPADDAGGRAGLLGGGRLPHLRRPMARTALPGRLTWRAATLAESRPETATARTLVLDVPDWPGHLPGQHVDVRLTAPDGYRTQRSYSIGSAWPKDRGPDEGGPKDGGPDEGGPTGKVELTVQRLDD